MKAPILALMGGDDPGIPVEDVGEHSARLSTRRGRARGGRVPERAAQLLRSQVRGVRLGVRGPRLAARPSVHRTPQLSPRSTHPLQCAAELFRDRPHRRDDVRDVLVELEAEARIA